MNALCQIKRGAQNIRRKYTRIIDARRKVIKTFAMTMQLVSQLVEFLAQIAPISDGLKQP